MVGDLVALSRKAASNQLKDKSPQAGSRDQHFQGSPFGILLLLRLDGLQNRAIAGLTLCGTSLSPVAVQLTDSAPGLVSVSMLSNTSPLMGHGELGAIRAGGDGSERLQAEFGDGSSEIGVGIDGLIGLLESV